MSKKQNKLLIILFILTFLALTISTAFAIFTATRETFETRKDKASSTIMETVVFDTGGAININANSANFKEGMPSIVSETTGTVNLIAGSDTSRLASYKYNVTLNIDNNNFEYSTPDEKPELILMVTDPNGNKVRNINGLKFVSEGGYEGFDITKTTGNYFIVQNYKIETASNIIHSWKFEIVFVNYPLNQNINAGKYLNGYITLDHGDERL